MKQLSVLAALGALAFGAASAAPAHGEMPVDLDLDFYPRPHRGKGKNNRRGKGKRSPPKSRPNRLTISKRVRRKHRRAA